MSGSKIAYVKNWHDLYDVNGNQVGYVKDWWNLFDINDNKIGYVKDQRKIFNQDGVQIGYTIYRSELYDMSSNFLAVRKGFWDIISSRNYDFDLSDQNDLALLLGLVTRMILENED